MQLAWSGLQLKSSAERSFVQMQAVVVSSGSPCTKVFPIRGILQVKSVRRENGGDQIIFRSASTEEEPSGGSLLSFLQTLNGDVLPSVDQASPSALAERMAAA